MPSVLNTAFYLPFGTREVARVPAEASLIQDLLCYDTVWVLTDHMAAAAMLAGIMGREALELALRSRAIRFVHDRRVLAWPLKAGFSVTPILLLESGPRGEGKPAAFTQASTGAMVAHALTGFDYPSAFVRAVASLAEEGAVQFGMDKDAGPTAKTLAEAVADDLRLFEDVATSISDFPLSRGEFIRIRRALGNPRSSPLNTRRLRVTTTVNETGWSLLTEKEPVSRKQLAMLNLFLTGRFFDALRELEAETTLHTEPIVASLLTARTQAFRAAAGTEVSELLSFEDISLPVLRDPSAFPYMQLLRARETRAGQAFREMVARRDSIPSSTLMHEYIKELKLGDSIGVKIGRIIISELVGKVPGLSLIAGAVDAFAVDKLLARGKAKFFIDPTLRRLSK